jgi:hypothetical protein
MTGQLKIDTSNNQILGASGLLDKPTPCIRIFLEKKNLYSHIL